MQMGSWGREKCEIKLTFLKQNKPESNVLENELLTHFSAQTAHQIESY